MPTQSLPRGLMGELVLADQSVFATPVTTGFVKTPFYTEGFAQTEGLPDDEIIGGSRHNDRDSRAPAPDLATHAGQLEVPFCLNNIGWWLAGGFGDPATSAVAATGSLVFASQPAVASTITINGKAFTFVADEPGSDEIELGANLAATITAIKTALNSSADAGVDDATYDEADGTTVTVAHDTGGPAGNAFTLAASAGSHATPSGATLSGGHYAHVFASGGEELPSRSIGIRRRVPAVGDPIWFRQVGCVVSALRFGVAHEAGFRRLGVDMMGRLEEKVAEAVFGTPDDALALDQVAAAIGVVKLDGVAVGSLMRTELTYDNGLAALDFASGDKFVSGFALDNPAKFSGSLTVRYDNEDLYDWSADRSAKALEVTWSVAAGRSLTLAAPAVRIERFGIGIRGPAGIEATVNMRAEQTADDAMLTATLRNALSAYPEA